MHLLRSSIKQNGSIGFYVDLRIGEGNEEDNFERINNILCR